MSAFKLQSKASNRILLLDFYCILLTVYSGVMFK